jgi:hypothetical protein
MAGYGGKEHKELKKEVAKVRWLLQEAQTTELDVVIVAARACLEG